jgi:hypothetical protein
LRAHLLHPGATIRTLHVAGERRPDARQNETTAPVDAARERGGQIDQRCGQHVGEHERPRVAQCRRPALHETESRREAVETCVPRRHAHRLRVDVNRNRRRHAGVERGKRENS